MATAANDPLDFRAIMGPVACELLGEPNKGFSTARELRWGNKGSLVVDLEKGAWVSHEDRDRGGGVLDLIRDHEGCDMAGAFQWLERHGFKTAPAALGTGAIRRATGSVFYDYADESGQVLFRIERRGKDAVPPFLQHGPDGSGGFHSARGCMQGVRRVPYRLTYGDGLTESAMCRLHRRSR